MTSRTEFTDCLLHLLILIFILEKELKFKVTWPCTHLTLVLLRHLERKDKRLCYSQPLCVLTGSVNIFQSFTWEIWGAQSAEEEADELWWHFAQVLPRFTPCSTPEEFPLAPKEPFPSQPWWAASGGCRAVWSSSCLPAECQRGTGIAWEGAAAGSARVMLPAALCRSVQLPAGWGNSASLPERFPAFSRGW